MRWSLVISALVHAGIVAAALVSLPDGEGFEASPVTSLPVELVEIADETDIRTGSEDAEAVLEEATETTETVEAETPSETPGLADTAEVANPQETRANALTAVSTAPEPAGAPEVSEDVPEPPERPEMTVAALPESEDAAEANDPAPAEEAVEEERAAETTEAPTVPADVVPRARPTPPPRATRETRRPSRSEEAFDADEVANLINRADTSGGGDGAGEASLGERKGRTAARMTLSELDSLRAQMERCWNPPIGAVGGDSLAVRLIVRFNPDGTVEEVPPAAVLAPTPAHIAAADSARRAVLNCQPYELPAEKYDLWKEVQVTFDPRTLY